MQKRLLLLSLVLLCFASCKKKDDPKSNEPLSTTEYASLVGSWTSLPTQLEFTADKRVRRTVNGDLQPAVALKSEGDGAYSYVVTSEFPQLGLDGMQSGTFERTVTYNFTVTRVSESELVIEASDDFLFTGRQSSSKTEEYKKK